MNIDEVNASASSLSITFCSGSNAVTVPTDGFIVAMDVKFQSPYGLAFGDDGNGGGGPGILVGTDGGAGWTIYNGGPPLTSGAWYHMTRTIPPYSTTTATYLAFRFVPLQAWSGTIFLDNISLTPAP